MPNRKYAIEWLQLAYRNLYTARRLYDVDHFTDIIVVDLQQAIEKMLKSILAYDNKKIPKSHFLDELASLLTGKINFDEGAMLLLEKATDYYRENRYPNPHYTHPTKEETKEILDFAEALFRKICGILEIGENDVILNK
ncbi:MAG: HEPN domain-containing protein [Thermodesulfobacteriota bacterium]|nr:HEPN domain-containing protein [Thermodesulfobacteriota bacterium]